MATTSKTTKVTMPVAKKTAAPKVAKAGKTIKGTKPAGNIRSAAEAIAGLSHEDRVKLHQGFTTHINADNNAVSVGRTPDGSNYNEWIKTFE